jgi:hypothetical protein
MEIVEGSDSPKQHKWLRWVGLQDPPPEADSWVPVVRGLQISDVKTHTSTLGARLVDRLSDAGIQAQQRSYEFNDRSAGVQSVSGLPGLAGHIVTRVAVLVHNRDRERATQIAIELDRESKSQTISDEELTRLALDAGRPPDAC